MFHVAACPHCESVQLHKDLETVPYRSCRVCEKRVAGPAWRVLHTHSTFDEAKRDLRAYTGGGKDPRLRGGPPVPDAIVPWRTGGPNQRQRLLGLLRELAEEEAEVTDTQLTELLADIECAHLRRHLIREGLVYRVGGASDDFVDEGSARSDAHDGEGAEVEDREEPRYRVSVAALDLDA